MSSSFRMAHIASCLQELMPFVNDNSLFMRIMAIAGASVSYGHISSLFIVFEKKGQNLKLSFAANYWWCFMG